MTLNEVMKETAEAIREKKGTSELIAPVNFAEEIKSISVGGGESGGNTSNWRYFDTTKATVTEDNLPVITLLFPLFKTKFADTYKSILCGMPPLKDWEWKYVLATATDFNLKIYNPEIIGEVKTIEEVLNDMGGVESFKQALGFTEITKEEFYDLNA